ncbi:hypothetical protein [Vibrio sp. 10N.261.51.F12]|uniref:hypothetical protein n=1 Tax=Vibrio sp. 10N.261.51.F12 TaxID=3229679 RepID=UPI003551CD65
MSNTSKRALLLLLLLMLAFHTLLLQAQMPLNGDVAFLLNMAKHTEWSHFYLDYYEVNPPLIIYIYKLFMVPYYLGYVSDISSLRIAVVSYLLFAIYLSWANLLMFEINQRLLLIFSLSLGLFTISQSAFAQREHLIAAGLVVYFSHIVRAQLGKGGGALSVISMFMLSMSICLKPQYFIVFIVVEAYLLVTKSTACRWKEYVTVGLLGFSYIVFVYQFQTEYIEHIIPLAREYYGVYFKSMRDVVKTASVIFIVMFFPYLLLKKVYFDKRVVFLLLLFFVSCLSAYIMGRSAFGYHLIPAFTFSFSLVYMAIILLSNKLVHNIRIINIIFVMIALVPVCVFKYQDLKRSYQLDYGLALHRLLSDKQNITQSMFVDEEVLNLSKKIDQYSVRGQNITFVASTGMSPHHTIPIHSGLPWLTKQPNFWLLPLTIKYRENDSHKDTMRFVQKTITDDINDNKPSLIVVHLRERTATRYGESDLLNALMEYPPFVTALSTYRKVDKASIEESTYELYVRELRSD